MKNKFPRFFKDRDWQSIAFVRIDNDREKGILFCKNGDRQKSSYNLKMCLCSTVLFEIRESEAVLML